MMDIDVQEKVPKRYLLFDIMFSIKFNLFVDLIVCLIVER
jgi:hypothetical protein